MLMKAYIQQQNGQWLNENCYASWYGLTRMGFEVHPFTMENIPIDITRETIVHGGVNTIRKVFDMLEVEQPLIHNPQDHLPQYCNREFEISTIGEINTDKDRPYPYFIKPLKDHKLFTGFVVNNSMDKLKIYGKPIDTEIMVSEYVNMVTEYRCFVRRGKLVGSKNYTGDFKKNIDYNIVENAIKDYKEQPIAYSIDFALTDKDETVLIEMNDGFSLGSYGLNPIIYSKMIVDRWNEINQTGKRITFPLHEHPYDKL